MVSALKKWLGVTSLEAFQREQVEGNSVLLKTAKHSFEEVDERLKSSELTIANQASLIEDHEVRIAFLENSLTAKASTAKIVPKAHKRTFRQFAEAASKATESQETDE